MSDDDRDRFDEEQDEQSTQAPPHENPPQMPFPGISMDDFVRNFASSMAQHLFPQSEQGGQGSRSRRSSRQSRRATLMGQYQKLNPPTYQGNEGPEMAERWIKKLEKIFNALDCTDADRIALAEYSMEGEAEHWWTAEKGTYEDTTGLSWRYFRRKFLGKYFPFSFRDRKAREFEMLVQGTRTVDEYEAKFAELSKYAPLLVGDPVERARRFERGLNPPIRRSLAPFILEDYDDIYRRAQAIEQTAIETAERRTFQAIVPTPGVGKRPLRGIQISQGPSKRSSSTGSRSGGSSSGHSDGSSSGPYCTRCGTRH